MSARRKARIIAIGNAIRKLNGKINILVAERFALESARAKEDHPCSCVQLNKDMGIFYNDQRITKRRRPIGLVSLGTIGEDLSASYDCISCRGTGKPR